MIIYGINPVREALESGLPVREIFVADRSDGRIREVLDLASRSRVRIVRKDRNFFREGSIHVPQNLAADIEIGLFPFDELLRPESLGTGLFIVLDLIEDPRNFGAILRNASASGVSGVVIQSHRACRITPAVFSASAGAVAHMKVSEVPNIKNAINSFREEGFQVVGADSGGSGLYWDVDFTPPTVLVLGSEGKGMRKTVKDHCDTVVRIPMLGRISSLNVSVASGILLFEIIRQRERKG